MGLYRIVGELPGARVCMSLYRIVGELPGARVVWVYIE